VKLNSWPNLTYPNLTRFMRVRKVNLMA
jgi:hypothetical protein